MEQWHRNYYLKLHYIINCIMNLLKVIKIEIIYQIMSLFDNLRCNLQLHLFKLNIDSIYIIK